MDGWMDDWYEVNVGIFYIYYFLGGLSLGVFIPPPVGGFRCSFVLFVFLLLLVMLVGSGTVV